MVTSSAIVAKLNADGKLHIIKIKADNDRPVWIAYPDEYSEEKRRKNSGFIFTDDKYRKLYEREHRKAKKRSVGDRLTYDAQTGLYSFTQEIEGSPQKGRSFFCLLLPKYSILSIDNISINNPKLDIQIYKDPQHECASIYISTRGKRDLSFELQCQFRVDKQGFSAWKYNERLGRREAWEYINSRNESRDSRSARKKTMKKVIDAMQSGNFVDHSLLEDIKYNSNAPSIHSFSINVYQPAISGDFFGHANDVSISHLEVNSTVQQGSTHQKLTKGEVSMTTTNRQFFEVGELVQALSIKDKPACPLTDADKAILEVLYQQLFRVFKGRHNPPSSWIAELVSLGLYQETSSYQNIVNHFLECLETTPVIESRMIRGISDLLLLGEGQVWLQGDGSTSHITQLFTHLMETSKCMLFQEKGLTLSQAQDNLGLWRTLLHSLALSEVKIPDSIKKSIKRVLKGYKTIFNEANDDTWIWTVEIAEQHLYRVHDDAPPAWVKPALCLGAAGLNLCEAAAAGASGVGTYGLGAIGALPSFVKAVGNVGGAGVALVQAINEARRKEDWYRGVIHLQAACLGSAFLEDGGKTFGDILVASNGIDNKQRQRVFAHSMCDVFKQVVASFPGEAYRSIHESIFDCLVYYFNQLDDIGLRARIVDMCIEIAQKVGVAIFVDFNSQLINAHTSDYYELPVYESNVDSLTWLYASCEAEANDNVQLKLLQLAILNRLKRQFASRGSLPALQVLAALSLHDHGLSQINIEKTKDSIEKMVSDFPTKMQQALDRERRRQQSAVPPRMLLTAWYCLSEDQHAALNAVASKLGLEGTEVQETTSRGEDAEHPSYLFGHVTHMVIASLIERGALQINYPEDLTAEEKSDFALKLLDRKVQQSSQAGPLGSSEKMTPLAKQVDFSFIGNYVRGTQIGVPMGVIKETMKFAREIVEDMKKDSSIESVSSQPSVDLLLAHKKDSPIHSSDSKNIPASDGAANEEILSRIGEAVSLVKLPPQDERIETYELRIDYGAGEIFDLEDGVNQICKKLKIYIAEPKRNRITNISYDDPNAKVEPKVISFSSIRAAERVLAALKELFPANCDHEGIQAEKKSGAGSRLS